MENNNDKKNVIGTQAPYETGEKGNVSQHSENDVFEVRDMPENRFVGTTAEELGENNDGPDKDNAKEEKDGRNMPSDERVTEND